MIVYSTRVYILEIDSKYCFSSGAGIYVRYYVPEMKQWQRKIIGIFSGNLKAAKYGDDSTVRSLMVFSF